MITHFLYCPFTGLGLHNGYRGDEWLKNRIKIFKQFVVPSLLNQTNKNFILWISWRPEEESNPIVLDFVESLKGLRDLQVVHTFNGLCFWDDKYPDEVASSRLNKSLALTLPQLRQYVDGDTVLMTIQPSDDMYLNEAIERIQQNKYSTGFYNGYIINYATKELAEYNPSTPPPFYTLYFTKDDFLNPYKHPRNKSHEQAPVNHIPFVRGYCVGTHGENISTVFNHPYKGRTIEGEEKDSILIKLGIWQTPPLSVGKTGIRLWSRRVLNRLPFQKQLRELYHKSKWQIF